jgi:hypothetical protein
MTFEEFQATRRRAENAEALESLIGGNTGFNDGVSGYVYHGGLHIFDLDGGFELVIGHVVETMTSKPWSTSSTSGAGTRACSTDHRPASAGQSPRAPSRFS